VRLLAASLGFMLTSGISVELSANEIDRDILWRKVFLQCMPNYIESRSYYPCDYVDLVKKYVIYKVDYDRYQYLLMPSDPISGIEDPKLTRDDVPLYLSLAWKSKSFLLQKVGKAIGANFISLSVNPINARSQDQLHIHISCLSGKVLSMVAERSALLSYNNWQDNFIRFHDHFYSAIKISRRFLEVKNVFKIVKDHFISTDIDPKYSGVALISLRRDQFAVLISSGSPSMPIAPEELQDHTCRDAINEAKN
jgi:CDP-diacylglycerol pyrophosphatase